MNKIRIIRDIYDEMQDKWVQGEVIKDDFIRFKGWSSKWNRSLKEIPEIHIEKGFTHTKRFRPKLGDIVQIKLVNIGKGNMIDFKRICNNKISKTYYPNLIRANKDIWINAIVVSKTGLVLTVLYSNDKDICILKLKRDSDIICEKNTHSCKNKNIFFRIFKTLSMYKTHMEFLLKSVKNFKNIFLHDIKIHGNIVEYFQFDTILGFILDNINYFDDQNQKISFLKTLLLVEKLKKKCYFELAHIYINNKNIDKRIIFRYFCLSDNTNVGIKYIMNEVYLENDINDPIDTLYDLLCKRK